MQALTVARWSQAGAFGDQEVGVARQPEALGVRSVGDGPSASRVHVEGAGGVVRLGDPRRAAPTRLGKWLGKGRAGEGPPAQAASGTLSETQATAAETPATGKVVVANVTSTCNFAAVLELNADVVMLQETHVPDKGLPAALKKRYAWHVAPSAEGQQWLATGWRAGGLTPVELPVAPRWTGRVQGFVWWMSGWKAPVLLVSVYAPAAPLAAGVAELRALLLAPLLGETPPRIRSRPC